MSMPTPQNEEPQAETTTPDDGWSLIALVPHDGREPPASVGEEQARSVWSAVSAIWHPSLLARSRQLPRIESIEQPSSPGPREVRIIAGDPGERLPSGYRTQAEDAGVAWLEAGADRADLIARLQARIGVTGATDAIETEPMAATAADFLALGTAHWMLRDLTIGMNHSDGVDRESLWRELAAGAHAWQLGDLQVAASRLRAGFELLTQARERFYPVDAYLLDLCLLDPEMPAGSLAEPLAAAVPVTFIAP
ncbi:MAG TPA: hypothetical protein VKW77_10380, partial [Acidimicrobiales bacterium]|nr:hypothetical protein [Acidimicrobiales bacterium]